MTILTDAFVQVIVSPSARCALNRKILDLLDEESVYGESMVELITTSPTTNVELIAKVRIKIFFGLQIYIRGHQHRSLYPAHPARAG